MFDAAPNYMKELMLATRMSFYAATPANGEAYAAVEECGANQWSYIAPAWASLCDPLGRPLSGLKYAYPPLHHPC